MRKPTPLHLLSTPTLVRRLRLADAELQTFKRHAAHLEGALVEQQKADFISPAQAKALAEIKQLRDDNAALQSQAANATIEKTAALRQLQIMKNAADEARMCEKRTQSYAESERDELRKRVDQLNAEKQAFLREVGLNMMSRTAAMQLISSIVTALQPVNLVPQ